MALAKVRALHPDIFSDEDVCEVSIPARWLFAGLWCYACDNGHLADKPKQIKRWIYATDNENVAELLRELEDADGNLIERADGWITIPGLPKRNRIDRRWFKTCEREGCTDPERPAKPDSQPETRRGPAEPQCAHDETTRGHAAVVDGVVDGEGEGDGEVTASAGKPRQKRATQRPTDFRPSQAHIDLAAERGIDLRTEWAKFCDWCDANGKTYKDWSAALRNWIRNARPTQRLANQQSNVQQHLDLAQRLAEREQGATVHEIGGPR